MSSKEKHILKFGGTSLKNPDFIRQSARIVLERADVARPFVVVSAIGGVTDTLIELTDIPVHQERKIKDLVMDLKRKHLNFVEQLELPDAPKLSLLTLFEELKETAADKKFRNRSHNAWKDHILSVGERASAILFSAELTIQGLQATPFEAQHFIKTNSAFGRAQVEEQPTQQLIRYYMKDPDVVPVVTGFIGSDRQGHITTLGRSGSDYTAGLLADALQADHLEIWTDVDGVLTADPRWVPTAESISSLNFDDITELSAHGAKVIHPKTIRPIYNKDTSVLVKNSHNPAYPGTFISSNFSTNGSLKTITITGPYVWIQVENYHALPLLDHIKHLLKEEAGSGTVAFKKSSDFEPARLLVAQEVFDGIKEAVGRWALEQQTELNLHRDIYRLKKFSNQFRSDEQLTAKIWKLFARQQVQPLCVDRNYTERYVSFLFEKEEARRAARLLNDYLDYEKAIVDIFVAGTGAIGETLLRQLRNLELEEIQFRLLGVCNSRRALWNNRGISLEELPDWSKGHPTDWNSLREKLTESSRHNVIFVDATGSSDVARLYPYLLDHGVNVVTPSKLANTFEQSFYDQLQEKRKEGNATFRYETTVGAGLPVISTLEDLQSGCDVVRKVSGIVSGTMTYLFNELEKGVPFSQAVIEAREKGYAEPDPRDDLSGEDVARKFLTIARTLGISLEREELQVESLIPEALKEVDQGQFLEQLPQYDEQWERQINKAKQEGKTLRYVGQLEEGEISIGLQAVLKDSPLGQLKGTDNLLQIFTDFYNQTPLIIQGPGAGKKVTAAGVLADVLKTANILI